MKLSAIQEQMRPAAEAAMDKGLTYHQAQRAFLLTFLTVALERAGKLQKQAAEMIRISAGRFSQLMNGKGLPDKKSSGRKWRDRKAPAERTGAMDL